MAHQSFENEEIAEIMNELFVNIKVDREERPDIDKIYMVLSVLWSIDDDSVSDVRSSNIWRRRLANVGMVNSRSQTCGRWNLLST